MGSEVPQSPQLYLPFAPQTSINDEAIIQTLKQGSSRTASVPSLSFVFVCTGTGSGARAGCPVRVGTLWGDHRQMFQYKREIFSV